MSTEAMLLRDTAHLRARPSGVESALGALVFRPYVDFAQFGLNARQIPRRMKAPAAQQSNDSDTVVDMRKFLVSLGEWSSRTDRLPKDAPGFLRGSRARTWARDPALRYVWTQTDYALDGGFVVGRQAIAAELGMTVPGLESWLKGDERARALLRKTATTPALWVASVAALTMLDQMRAARWSGSQKTAPGRKKKSPA